MREKLDAAVHSHLEEEKMQTSSAVIFMMDFLCHWPSILICSKTDPAQCFTLESQQLTDKKLTRGSHKQEVDGTASLLWLHPQQSTRKAMCSTLLCLVVLSLSPGLTLNSNGQYTHFFTGVERIYLLSLPTRGSNFTEVNRTVDVSSLQHLLLLEKYIDKWA